MMNSETFKFVVPADLEKSKDGEWKIKGLASTESKDLQGEIILQKGVDLTPIENKKGIINFDHMRGPENTIGLLDGYQRTEQGLYIEGRLFKNHSKAKAVYEIMSSLGDGDRGRVGLSVEGRIIKRNAQNPAIIEKCQINAVAVTLNPVNPNTYANLVKSLNATDIEFNSEETVTAENTSEEAVFTASQVIQIVQKALSIGSGSLEAPNTRSGGDALVESSMRTKKKKIKKMCKSLYKSNIISILDQLQVLYPENSRSEIWEAVRDRLDTRFETENN